MLLSELRKIRKQDMSYKFELWDLSFKNWVLSNQQTKQTKNV